MAARKGSYISGRTVSTIWKAFRQLNPRNVQEECGRNVLVGLVGPTELIQEAAAYLLGDDPAAFDRSADALILLPAPLEQGAFALLPRCDVVLQSRSQRGPLPGVAPNRVFEFDRPEDLRGTAKRILHDPDLAYLHMPLARLFPTFRAQVGSDIIQSTSIENAAFVASTSLGNIIPNPLQPLTSLAEALGDVVVLTANQLRMVFRLACIHGQPLGFRQQAPEVMSIVGAAFGWRAIARELVAKLPFGAGVVPKSAIAFAGTWAIGDAAVYYYTTGKRLTKEEMRQRFDAALEKGKAATETVIARIKESYADRVGGAGKPGE